MNVPELLAALEDIRAAAITEYAVWKAAEASAITAGELRRATDSALPALMHRASAETLIRHLGGTV
jgi:hypothetical protein